MPRQQKQRTRLARLIIEKQASRTDREVAEQTGWLQQTFNRWKNGGVPRPDMYASLAEFLGVTRDEVEELVLDARQAESSPVPKSGIFNTAKTYGRVSDRKDGKYAFEAFNNGRKRIPDGRYWIEIDTKIMEPALPVGTRAWVDPAVWPRGGMEVIVHAKGGAAWLGRLQSLGDGTASLTRDAGPAVTIRDVEAVHAIVLSERIPAG
jgi:transcriptional regulator with XRE-family HTH domain